MKRYPKDKTNGPGSISVPPALDIVNLHVSFKERRQKLSVLNGLSLTVEKGEFVAIVGPSGRGKSTLFHIIGGLLKPQDGQVLMNGKQVTGQRGHISYMPQQPALFPWRTIEDNVLLAGEIASATAYTAPVAPRAEALAEARRWLAALALQASSGHILINCQAECNSVLLSFVHCSARRN